MRKRTRKRYFEEKEVKEKKDFGFFVNLVRALFKIVAKIGIAVMALLLTLASRALGVIATKLLGKLDLNKFKEMVNEAINEFKTSTKEQ